MKKLKLLIIISMLFFINISNALAEETKTGLGYLNNSSVIISDNRGNDIQLSRLTTNTQDITIRNIIFQSNYNFQKDIVYEYEIELANQYIDNISSIYLRGGNTICSFISLEGLNNSYLKVRFTCPSNVSYITIGLSNLGGSAISDSYNIQWKNIYLWQITDAIDLGPIINGQNQNTQDIINNQNTNNQNIINNNDENTQKIIDSNKENFQSCRNSYNLLDFTSGTTTSNGITAIWENGEVTLNGTATSTVFIQTTVDIPQGTVVSISANNDEINNNVALRLIESASGGNTGAYTALNAKNKVTNGYTALYNFTRFQIRVASGTTLTNFKLKPQLQEGSVATDYEPYGEEICINKLDEQNKTSKGILGKLGDLFNTLFSNEDADISGLDNMVGWLPPGPLDSIINLPLNFFNSLTNVLTGTCSPVSLTIPFVNQILILPCFDTYMSQYLTGFNTLWTFIGVTLSVFILYRYLLSLYKWIDDTLTLRENNLPGYYEDRWGGGA